MPDQKNLCTTPGLFVHTLWTFSGPQPSIGVIPAFRAGAFTARSSTPPVDELGETNPNHVRQDLVVVPYGHH
ncbi:hypothetical protein CITRIK5_30209 [Citricoccus sp. K5]|nr:hypothetical protein CITRIK5_30209 [Citricoccus sp. K5]